MGGAASVLEEYHKENNIVKMNDEDEENKDGKIRKVALRGMQEAIQDAIYVKEKWPCIIDKQELGRRFLRYQSGAFLYANDPEHMDKNRLRKALVGGLKHGNTLCINFDHEIEMT